MISLDRTPCPDALNPDDPTSSGAKEFVKIKTKLDNGETPKSTDFSAYAKLEVRDALREMFHGKCAYCETKIAGAQDTDVEHYRPKKGVSEATDAGVDHGGYWWLAMVWENLVLSCQHCNQSRSKQIIIPDDVQTLEELEAFLIDPPRSTTGKLNAFPTSDNTWVTDPDGDIDTESPLIINPVDVDPEDHLEWVLLEGASTVRAKNASEAGQATLDILGLNRRWLEEHRRVELRKMLAERNEIIEAMNRWLTAATDAEAEPWGFIAESAIARLQARTESDQPYAGLARAFLTLVQDEVDAMN